MPMRPISLLRFCMLAFLVLVTPGRAQLSTESQTLAAFAQRAALEDVRGFVETVESLRKNKRLPSRYATKDEAKARGWHGGGLCAVWPGHAIGGDEFHNFGRALPAGPGRVYREADLDSTCRSRGAKRLIYSNDGLIFITTDHYNSFAPVP
jgi:hypothetical protein